jgi:hypothetical protein
MNREPGNLQQDGAISAPDDPDASLFAAVIHTVGGTYTGKSSIE